MPADEPDSDAPLFEPTRDKRWLPTTLARGPWSADALHGGPVAALLARDLERLDDRSIADNQFHPARLTVELLRPVPLAPLTVESSVVRPGKKVRLSAASVRAGDTEVARALLLQIRAADVEMPKVEPGSTPPPPAEGQPWDGDPGDVPAFHNRGVEHRFVAGAVSKDGPATDWIRLRIAVTPDEEPSPLQRVAAAADFGNGISRVADRNEFLFINPDLTVYLERLPEGEWVCLDAITRSHGLGVGLAESVLYDENGRIGRALQSLLLEARA